MPDGFGSALNTPFGDKKDCLLREADEAFQSDDKASGVEAIDQLYDLFDSTLIDSRRGWHPSWAKKR